MNKKMLMSVPAVLVVLTMTACGSGSSVDSVAAQPAEKLQEWLLSAEESGLEGAQEANDTVLSGETIPLVVTPGSAQFEGSCGEALQKAEAANLPTVGSAARVIELDDGSGVAIAQFSTEEGTEISPSELYSEVASSCTEPIKDSETGVEYSFAELDSDADGMVFSIDVTPGNESTSVMMLKEFGNHHVMVVGRDVDQATTKTLFDKQIEKTESELIALS